MSEPVINSASQSTVLTAAKWLGGLGALPFVLMTAAIHEIGGLYNPQAPGALVGYGAVILTFLGGVQWGLSMAVRDNAGATWERLVISIIPSLIGWAALFMPLKSGILALAGAFVVVLAIDLLWNRAGRSPLWYPKLRIPLTVIVVTCLIVAHLGL